MVIQKNGHLCCYYYQGVQAISLTIPLLDYPSLNCGRNKENLIKGKWMYQLSGGNYNLSGTPQR